MPFPFTHLHLVVLTDGQFHRVKDEIIAAGGTVGDDFTLINGFRYVFTSSDPAAIKI